MRNRYSGLIAVLTLVPFVATEARTFEGTTQMLFSITNQGGGVALIQNQPITISIVDDSINDIIVEWELAPTSIVGSPDLPFEVILQASGITRSLDASRLFSSGLSGDAVGTGVILSTEFSFAVTSRPASNGSYSSGLLTTELATLSVPTLNFDDNPENGVSFLLDIDSSVATDVIRADDGRDHHFMAQFVLSAFPTTLGISTRLDATIPEPTTATLLILGVMGDGMRRRVRR